VRSREAASRTVATSSEGAAILPPLDFA